MPKKINIVGDIISNDYAWIYDWMEWDYTCPKNVRRALDEAGGENVEFIIDSPGGSVFDGYNIYNAIREYSGKTTAKIIGLAASAASFISQAADEVVASPLSQIMIHRASTGTRGNAPVHNRSKDFLEKIDNTIVKAYTFRNNKSDEAMLELMTNETWFTADEALENGIVDRIMYEDSSKPRAFNSIEGKQEIIDKLIGLGSVENIKKALLENQTGQMSVTNTLDNTKNKEEEKVTVENFKLEHSDLYNQIVEDSTKQAVINERERIKEIQNLSVPGVENIINDGIENGSTAGEVAMNIIKNQKEKGANYIKNAQKDAELLNEVENQEARNKTSEHEKDEEAANNMANIMNGGFK